MGTIIQMRGAITGGSENAIAAIDVPMNGNLIYVSWHATIAYDTDGDYAQFQLSFGSSHSIANDARQVLSNCLVGAFESVTAVGVVPAGINVGFPIPDVPVGMGERLYVHSLAAAAIVGAVTALLHFDFDLDKVQVRRR